MRKTRYLTLEEQKEKVKDWPKNILFDEKMNIIGFVPFKGRQFYPLTREEAEHDRRVLQDYN